MRRLRAWALVAAACGVGGCAASAADVRVQRLDVDVSVHADGSLQVREHLHLRLEGGGPASFRRVVPAWQHDGVSDVRASADATADGANVAARSDGDLDVQWEFGSAAETRRDVALDYRVAGAIEVSGIRGTLSWRVLSPDRGVPVDEVHVLVTLPEGVVLLDDPWVEEAGWTVTREPRGLSATKQGIAADEAATVGLVFAVDTLRLETPRWQFHRARAREFAPAFVSAGVFLLVVAIGAAGMVRLKYPPYRARSGQGEPAALERERAAVVRDLKAAGLVTIGLGGALWVTAALALPSFGIWPLAVPAGLLAGGLLLLASVRWIAPSRSRSADVAANGIDTP